MRIVVVNKYDLYNYLDEVKKFLNYEIIEVKSIDEANKMNGDIVIFSYNELEKIYNLMRQYENGIGTIELEKISGINKRSIERHMLKLAKIKKNIGYYNHKWYIVK